MSDLNKRIEAMHRSDIRVAWSFVIALWLAVIFVTWGTWSLAPAPAARVMLLIGGALVLAFNTYGREASWEAVFGSPDLGPYDFSLPSRTGKLNDSLACPADFTGDGELFMLRVRGESMIELGILDGDFVIATQIANPNNGDIVVAGIPGGEATIKTYSRSGAQVTLTPANSTMAPMEFTADDVEIYGKVVTVMRRY